MPVNPQLDWQTGDVCSPILANGVVADIADAVRDLKQAHDSIENVVVIGGDERIPFFRAPDTTAIANESTYADQMGGESTRSPLRCAVSTS